MSKTFRGNQRQMLKSLAKYDRRSKVKKRAKKQGFADDIAMEFHEPQTFAQSKKARNFFLTGA